MLKFTEEQLSETQKKLGEALNEHQKIKKKFEELISAKEKISEEYELMEAQYKLLLQNNSENRGIESNCNQPMGSSVSGRKIIITSI